MVPAAGNRRKRKIGNSISAEITAEDVLAMWRKSNRRGTQPDAETNKLVAEVLNAHRVQSVPPPVSPATLKAVKTLLDDDLGNVALLGSDAPEFRRMLEKLEPMTKAYHQGQMNSWQPVAVLVVHSVAAGILEKLGQAAGKSRDSVAVKFTAAALRRMGWNGIKEPGIEALLKQKSRKQS